MSSYLILFAIFAIIAVIYFVLVHNKPAPKTDWEQLPQLDEYKKLKNQSMQIINPAVVFVVIVKSIKDYYNPRKKILIIQNTTMPALHAEVLLF